MFADPNHVVVENDFADGEQREQAIGITASVALAAVIFVDRSDADSVVIRIISARKANAYETRIYTAQSQNH